MVTVHTFGKKDIKEVSFEEASKMLEETYNNPVGGIVVDARTHEIISRLTPEHDEIVIIEQMLGGG